VSDRFEKFFHLSRALFCTANGETNRFEALNPVWEDTLGWTLEELRSRPFTEFIHPDDLQPTFDIIADMQQRGLDAVDFENRYLHKTGSWVRLSWHGTFLDGSFYATARDVTAYHRTLDDLQAANRELTQFAYAAAHDLQEPLRAITGHLRFVPTDGLDERARASLGHINDGARHMQALLDGLLEFSRIGSRGTPFEPTPLGDPVTWAIRTLAGTIEEEQAEVLVQGTLPTIVVDPLQMRRLFQNLLSNALKFRKDDTPPRVVVDALDEGTDWVIRVADNGVGLNPDRAERAFQIFQRLHRRSKYPGSGLGLALVRRIAQRHGGTAWIEGSIGEGATVSVRLPKRRSAV